MESQYGRIAPPLPPKAKKLAEVDVSRRDIKCHNDKPTNSSCHVAESSKKNLRVSPPRLDTVPSANGQSAVDARTFTKKSYSLNSRSGKGIVGRIASAFSEPVGRRSENSFKIITWADKNPDVAKTARKGDEEFLYQNVSNSGTNYIEYKLKNIINKEGKQSRQVTMKPHDAFGKNKKSYKVPSGNDVEKTESIVSPTWMTASTRQIQVHQVKNKTVVKISASDRPDVPSQIPESNYFKPLNEDDLITSEYQYPELLFKNSKSSEVNEYAEPYRGDPDKATQLYANVDLSKKRKHLTDGQIYENSDAVDAGDAGDAQVYMNVVNNGEAYANLGDDSSTVQEHHYLNVNGTAIHDEPVPEPDDADQVYENEDFTVLRNSQVTQSIIQKNALPINEDVYQNTEFMTKNNILDSISFSGPGISDTHHGYQTPKSSLRLVVNEDPSMVKIKKKYVIESADRQESMDNGQYSHIDSFDSGNNSDHENMPSLSITAINEAKVVVTVSGQSEAEDRCHKRAESITSSGVGIDSEASDTEESNISCDSLNSNDLHTCSVSEDHGYHTPTSENKTESPVTLEYQNIKTPSPEPDTNNSEAFNRSYESDGADIIQQVANAAERIKSLRLESTNLYLARRIESCDDLYENYDVYDGKCSPDDTYQTKISQKVDKEHNEPPPSDELKTLPEGLLRDIQSRNIRSLSAYPKGEKDSTKLHLPEMIINVFQSPTLKHNRVTTENKFEEKRVLINERTYEERKTERICGLELDTDKFYKFHLRENTIEPVAEKLAPDDETFAGYRDYLARERPAAITSAKGTIRGVKNRVKAGIATFLQLQETKVYKDKDAGKIVVYSTTMGIVRETYQKCLKVKQILKTLMVKFEERDVFMSSEAQEEIRDRMRCKAILVPQVFVEGQHIGDAETIERLNETGELRKILKPYKSGEAVATCQVCGGYRLLPCRVCKGSKKSVHRNSFTAEFVSLKCMNCDSVGLMKCYAC